MQPIAHATIADAVGVDGRQLGELAAVDDGVDRRAEERELEQQVERDADDQTRRHEEAELLGVEADAPISKRCSGHSRGTGSLVLPCTPGPR